MCICTESIISCLITFNHVTRNPVKDYSHMWCEASLTGFSHMMLYKQAANAKQCPVKSGQMFYLFWDIFKNA